VKILCDSHVLVWWLSKPQELSARARAAIADPENDVFFSAASIWELGLKIAKGKLTIPADYVRHLREGGLSELPVRVDHADKATELPALHGDPFDRMLVAQAALEGLVLVTRDAAIREYAVPVLEA
jgi:PIN domain nuclease of toxin-antitoxin system